jgi:hypothetical protein
MREPQRAIPGIYRNSTTFSDQGPKEASDRCGLAQLDYFGELVVIVMAAGGGIASFLTDVAEFGSPGRGVSAGDQSVHRWRGIYVDHEVVAPLNRFRRAMTSWSTSSTSALRAELSRVVTVVR